MPIESMYKKKIVHDDGTACVIEEIDGTLEFQILDTGENIVCSTVIPKDADKISNIKDLWVNCYSHFS